LKITIILEKNEQLLLKKFLKAAYQPYKWLFFIPFVVIFTMSCGFICIFVAFIFGPDAGDIVAVSWSRVICLLAPVRVKITSRGNYNIHSSYVVVVNHQSLIDIPVLHGWLGLKIKWVMKQELKKIPVFGAACHSLGCIYVDRFDKYAAIKSMEDARKKLSRKASVLFFPEGTRTRDGKVSDFKKGAFHFAKDVGLPILPVTIKKTMHILPPDSLDLFPGTAEIIIHSSVDIENIRYKELDNIIARIRQTIINSL